MATALLTVTLGDKSASVDVQVAGLDVAAHARFHSRRRADPGPRRLQRRHVPRCASRQERLQAVAPRLRPVFDVRALADDLASRRVNVASPADSLMLLKPTAAVPHTGGQVIKPGSRYYETLRAMDRRRRAAQPDVAARDRHRNHAAESGRRSDRRPAADPRRGHVCRRHASAT